MLDCAAVSGNRRRRRRRHRLPTRVVSVRASGLCRDIFLKSRDSEAATSRRIRWSGDYVVLSEKEELNGH